MKKSSIVLQTSETTAAKCFQQKLLHRTEVSAMQNTRFTYNGGSATKSGACATELEFIYPYFYQTERRTRPLCAMLDGGDARIIRNTHKCNANNQKLWQRLQRFTLLKFTPIKKNKKELVPAHSPPSQRTNCYFALPFCHLFRVR